MLRRLLLRLLRDLALIPVTALLVYELAAALPVPSTDPKVTVRLEQERGSALAFLQPWQRLVRGGPIGDKDPKSTRDLGHALAGSLRIGLLGLLFALALGAAWAGVRTVLHSAVVDGVLEGLTILAYGTPAFVLALLVAMAVQHVPGAISLEPIAAAVVSIGPGVFLGTVLGGALRTEAGKPYMLTAVAKGRTRLGAVLIHALPNALPSLLDALAPVATALLAGSFVVETLFNLTYFGHLYVTAAASNDRDLVVVCTTVFAALLVLVSMAVEFARLGLDPRARTAALEADE